MRLQSTTKNLGSIIILDDQHRHSFCACTIRSATYRRTVFFAMSFLRVSGTKIVDEEDREVILRGAGLGGWMWYVVVIGIFRHY